MAILAECPICRKRQSVKNKICSCGENLDRAKRSRRVKYWITYRLPNKKQRREMIGLSIEDARVAEGKRKAQKKENRIFDMLPASKVTFRELSDWFLALPSVKDKTYYPTLRINLNSFLFELGHVVVGQIKPADLEQYQVKRKNAGYSESYIGQEIGAARTMINKAFENDRVGGDPVKTFKRVKKLLSRNANARDKILTMEQFEEMMKHLPRHTKEIFAMGIYTGMRKNEILSLTWDRVDLKERVIMLRKEDTKDREPRKVPICKELYAILADIPKALHDNHVFLYRGKPVTDIRDGIKRACEKASIPYGRFTPDGFVFHDLRHTFNTYMRKAGVPESVIMEITGHSTREMFDRYNSIDLDDKRKAVDQMEAYITKC